MNLFVGNLNPQTSENSLRTLFSEFGEIVSVKIPIDSETGLPRGFGFVEMADRFESYDAIDNIDGIYFEGQVISVKESKPKNGQGSNNRGNSRGGGGFRSNGGGGFRSNDRSGGGGFRSNDRSNGGGGYRSNDRSSSGGGFRKSYDNDRSSGSGGFRRSYDNDRSENRNPNSEDPNRQPGRRFSPRGPRPNQG